MHDHTAALPLSTIRECRRTRPPSQDDRRYDQIIPLQLKDMQFSRIVHISRNLDTAERGDAHGQHINVGQGPWVNAKTAQYSHIVLTWLVHGVLFGRKMARYNSHDTAATGETLPSVSRFVSLAPRFLHEPVATKQNIIRRSESRRADGRCAMSPLALTRFKGSWCWWVNVNPDFDCADVTSRACTINTHALSHPCLPPPSLSLSYSRKRDNMHTHTQVWYCVWLQSFKLFIDILLCNSFFRNHSSESYMFT